MKTGFTIFIFLFCFSAFSQNQKQGKINESYYFEIVGLIKAYKYIPSDPSPRKNSFKTPKKGLKFDIVKYEYDPALNDSIYVLDFYDIVLKQDTLLGLYGDTNFINYSDNNSYFWISKVEFDNAFQRGLIVQAYNISFDLDYGLNVAIPFKFRPKTAGENIRITPDITLGGYIGGKFRLNRFRRYYVTVPVFTLGLATLPINSETVDPSANDLNADGLVLGVTGSVGMVFHLEDFQLGFMTGWDNAAGELGKNWIYNGKQWFSFSIGFTFLGAK